MANFPAFGSGIYGYFQVLRPYIPLAGVLCYNQLIHHRCIASSRQTTLTTDFSRYRGITCSNNRPSTPAQRSSQRNLLLSLPTATPMPPISRIMFAVGATLDILVSLSIPVLFPEVNLSIVGITFTTNTQTGGLSFVNVSSGFIGLLNNVSVTDLLDVHVKSISR